MDKSSYWKNTVECFGWICMLVLPFWGMILVSAEFTGQHFVHTLLMYMK